MPFVARLLFLLRLKTLTLSLETMMDSWVGSAGTSAMGRSGDLHVPSGAVLFPAGGWRHGESWVAICGRAQRLVTCLTALAVSRGSFTSYRAEVRELRATSAAGCAPSDLDRALGGLYP